MYYFALSCVKVFTFSGVSNLKSLSLFFSPASGEGPPVGAPAM